MDLNQDVSTDHESIALLYLNDTDVQVLEAITEQIIPDDGGGAGASQAGVVYYIDRCLSGVSRNLQHVYRSGLRALEAYCDEEYSAGFADLSSEYQAEVVRRFLGPEVADAGRSPTLPIDDSAARVEKAELSLLTRLFEVVREHTIEGFFCDPAYGGNRGAVGWKLVGFPGAYWGYTEAQMGRGFDGRSLPIKTLADLRLQLRTNSLPEDSVYYRTEAHPA